MNQGYYLYEFNKFLLENMKFIIEKVGVPKTVIEIGVFQGYFTFNMTHMAVQTHPDYKHYSIDPYDISHDLDNDIVQDAYLRFEHNLKITPYPKNIEHLKLRSWDGLLNLINRGVKADLIYVDGDHMATTVLDDLVLSYKLLNIGGVMLCDDSTTWGSELNESKPVNHSPRLAVDSFIQCNWDKIQLLEIPKSYQTAFIKRVE